MTKEGYSSWGRQICVCAPTNNYDDLKRFSPRGRGVVTTDNRDLGEGFTPGSRYTEEFGGTSSATPTVAGVCGLILSRNPNLTALQVKQLLQQTADKDLKIDSETLVYESGDFADGFSLWFGHGKVNAFKAVKAAVPEKEITVDQNIQVDIEILDADCPIFSKIEIYQHGVINDIRIGIDLTHTYHGDLRIDVTAPDGTSVILHDHKGNSTVNIHTVYTVSELPALRAFVGKSIQGTWIISMVDNWKMDVGRLNSWRLLAKVATSSS